MSRYDLTLYGRTTREMAHRIIDQAPSGTRLLVKAARRTLPQNSAMWVCLSALSTQLTWHGQKLTPDDWKLVMLDGLKRELRIVPNIDGDGFVNLGRSSSDLSKDEMSDLIELIKAFGTKHGVIFEPEKEAA